MEAQRRQQVRRVAKSRSQSDNRSEDNLLLMQDEPAANRGGAYRPVHKSRSEQQLARRGAGAGAGGSPAKGSGRLAGGGPTRGSFAKGRRHLAGAPSSPAKNVTAGAPARSSAEEGERGKVKRFESVQLMLPEGEAASTAAGAAAAAALAAPPRRTS